MKIKRSEPKRVVLVTGANGFLGRHVQTALREKGYRVVPLDRPEFDLAKTLPRLPQNASACVHLAAQTPAPGILDSAYARVNKQGTQRLLERLARDCPSLESFVLASTLAVYGDTKQTPATEGARATPFNTYAQSKLDSETITQDKRWPFRVTVLRMTHLYGKDTSPDRILGRIHARVKKGEPVDVDLKGGPRVQPLHASDAADAIVRAVSHASHSRRNRELFNIAGPDTVSVRSLATRVGSRIQKRAVFHVKNGRTPEIVLSSVKAKRALGWKARVRLAKGLRQAV